MTLSKGLKIGKTAAFVIAGAVMSIMAAGCSADYEPVEIKVRSTDGFNNAGWTEYIVPESGTYEMEASDAANEADIYWEVYVTDRRYTGDLDKIAGSSVGGLIGNGGELTNVKKGSYMYVYCSENCDTLALSDELTSGANLVITKE